MVTPALELADLSNLVQTPSLHLSLSILHSIPHLI